MALPHLISHTLSHISLLRSAHSLRQNTLEPGLSWSALSVCCYFPYFSPTLILYLWGMEWVPLPSPPTPFFPSSFYYALPLFVLHFPLALLLTFWSTLFLIFSSLGFSSLLGKNFGFAPYPFNFRLELMIELPDGSFKQGASIFPCTKQTKLSLTNNRPSNDTHIYILCAIPFPSQRYKIFADYVDTNGDVVVPSIAATSTFFTSRDALGYAFIFSHISPF